MGLCCSVQLHAGPNVGAFSDSRHATPDGCEERKQPKVLFLDPAPPVIPNAVGPNITESCSFLIHILMQVIEIWI